jgi:hypothetical protein
MTLALVGCGSGSATTSSGTLTASSPSATLGLIAYAECMRRHGIPKFPDPTTQGNLVISPASGIDPSSAQYKSANQACAKLRPSATGVGMTPAEHARALARLTAYVHCMRGRAIPMADPFSGPNGGVGIALPRGVDPSSQTYKRADSACKHLLPSP